MKVFYIPAFVSAFWACSPAAEASVVESDLTSRQQTELRHTVTIVNWITGAQFLPNSNVIFVDQEVVTRSRDIHVYSEMPAVKHSMFADPRVRIGNQAQPLRDQTYTEAAYYISIVRKDDDIGYSSFVVNATSSPFGRIVMSISFVGTGAGERASVEILGVS
ncbi:hypothetical protein N8940_01890 [Sphingomonadaceae bacterium]|nr:hypothetical protein [Sphingomonadaceae bacterium]